MASSSLAVVLYAGSAATYVCEEGDVQPTYPLLPRFTDELLRSLQSVQPATAPSTQGDHHVSAVKQNVALIRRYLFPLLHQRTVFLVLPLSSTALYKEEWVRFCFHAEVQTRRLVVLSDTIADSFACGRFSCVVLHVSLQDVSVSFVEAGCSMRYGNSHVGSLQALYGEATTLKIAESLPAVAAAMALRNVKKNGESDEDDATIPPNLDIGEHQDVAVDLCDVKFRDGLVHAFGYRAYRDVVVVPQQQRLDAASRPSAKGKGKGKNRGHASSSLLDALRQAYTRHVRGAPGQLEKLLARVAHGGTDTSSEETVPCILAGEALAVPYVRQLYTYIIRRCGGAVWDAVEKERWAKQRRMRDANAEPDTNAKKSDLKRADHEHSNEVIASDPEGETATQLYKRLREASATSSSSDEDCSSAEENSDDDNLWLHIQPTPLPTAPWWLPLLGASVVSRLSNQDLQRAAITEDEARESNGTVVHWKMLL